MAEKKKKVPEIEQGEEPEKLEPPEEHEGLESSPAPELISGERKIKDLEDRVLRLQAEMDNLRKRSEKESARIRDTAGSDVMLELLPVLDEFSIAIKHGSKEGGESDFFKGMKMVYDKLVLTLQKAGLEEMECSGGNFDPYKHDAIRQEKGEDGKILDVIEKGYYFRGNILRHAKVIVGKKD